MSDENNASSKPNERTSVKHAVIPKSNKMNEQELFNLIDQNEELQGIRRLK